MNNTPQVLLHHHLKALKLPTFLSEYDRVAGRQLAARTRLTNGGRFATDAPSLPFKFPISRAELVQRPQELAVQTAIELFKRFQWEADEQRIGQIQAYCLNR